MNHRHLHLWGLDHGLEIVWLSPRQFVILSDVERGSIANGKRLVLRFMWPLSTCVFLAIKKKHESTGTKFCANR